MTRQCGEWPAYVVNSLVEFIEVGWNSAFKIEERIGIVIDFVFWCRCQAHQQAIEIIEDRLVFAVDRAMRLIDDDQVEMPRPKLTHTLLALVNQPHHRRVGRYIDPSLR